MVYPSWADSGYAEPVYVSEVVERAMVCEHILPCAAYNTETHQNPNFRRLDFDTCGPDIMRLDSVSIKFWIKSERMQEYQLLLEMTLSLRSLQFIGRSVGSSLHPSRVAFSSLILTSLPTSTILFHRIASSSN